MRSAPIAAPLCSLLVCWAAGVRGEDSGPDAATVQQEAEFDLLLSDTCYSTCSMTASRAALPIGPPELPVFACDARLRDVNTACAVGQKTGGLLDMYPEYPQTCTKACADAFVPYFWGCRAHATLAGVPIAQSALWNPGNGFQGRTQEFMSRCIYTMNELSNSEIRPQHYQDYLLVAPFTHKCMALPRAPPVANASAPPAAQPEEDTCCNACQESFDVGSALALVRDGATHQAQFRCKFLSFCYKAYDLVDEQGRASTVLNLYYYTPEDPRGECHFEMYSEPMRVEHMNTPNKPCRAVFFDAEETDSVMVEVSWRLPITWREKAMFWLRSCITPNFLGPVGTLVFCATYLTLRFSRFACI